MTCLRIEARCRLIEDEEVARPEVGAAPIQILNSYLAKYGEWDMVILAVIVIVFMAVMTALVYMPRRS